MSRDYLKLRAYLALHGGHFIGENKWIFRNENKAQDILDHATIHFHPELLAATVVSFGDLSSSIIIFNEN